MGGWVGGWLCGGGVINTGAACPAATPACRITCPSPASWLANACRTRASTDRACAVLSRTGSSPPAGLQAVATCPRSHRRASLPTPVIRPTHIPTCHQAHIPKLLLELAVLLIGQRLRRGGWGAWGWGGVGEGPGGWTAPVQGEEGGWGPCWLGSACGRAGAGAAHAREAGQHGCLGAYPLARPAEAGAALERRHASPLVHLHAAPSGPRPRPRPSLPLLAPCRIKLLSQKGHC